MSALANIDVILREFGFEPSVLDPTCLVRRLSDGRLCILARSEAKHALSASFRHFEGLVAIREHSAHRLPG